MQKLWCDTFLSNQAGTPYFTSCTAILIGIALASVLDWWGKKKVPLKTSFFEAAKNYIILNIYLWAFYVIKWELYIKQFCSILKYDCCFKEKHLHNYLSRKNKPCLFRFGYLADVCKMNEIRRLLQRNHWQYLFPTIQSEFSREN